MSQGTLYFHNNMTYFGLHLQMDTTNLKVPTNHSGYIRGRHISRVVRLKYLCIAYPLHKRSSIKQVSVLHQLEHLSILSISMHSWQCSIQTSECFSPWMFNIWFLKWSEIVGMDGQNSREAVTCLPVNKQIGRKLRL